VLESDAVHRRLVKGVFADANTNRNGAWDFLSGCQRLTYCFSPIQDCFVAHVEIVDTRDGVL
jgi:hypothetical protein